MLVRFTNLRSTNISNQLKPYKVKVQKRNVQVSVIGAASEVGSNVALLLKLNSKVLRLQLYDDVEKVKGVGMELAHIPGGPAASVFTGIHDLGSSLYGSDIVLVTTRTSRKPGDTREQMIVANTLTVQSVCKAIASASPNAFLAISTNPINSIIPFASAVLSKYNCYCPYKIFGITHLDTSRSKVIAGSILQKNPKDIYVPVIGGHSDQTIIPLFSNLTPCFSTLDPWCADTMTRLVRKAGTEIVRQKQGAESATSAVAWSIHEFIDGLIDAVCGRQVVLNSYTFNPHFGTRYFSGPTSVGYCGIIKPCSDFSMSDYESFLLKVAIPIINRDVAIGEDYVRYIESLGRS